jgi:hypothetical protein
LSFRPNFRRVSGEFVVALVTREPSFTASEFDRDHIAFTVVMSAPRFIIKVRTSDFHSMNRYIHFDILLCRHVFEW